MTTRRKRIAVYERCITRCAEQLLARQRQEQHAVEKALPDALERFALVHPESTFYETMVTNLRAKWKSTFNFDCFLNARRGSVDKYLRQLPDWLEEGCSKYMNVMCMFMLLPEDLSRRWLWHENVDFQTFESFLRRLTKEQYESLVVHSKLSRTTENNAEYPCYRDGLANKTWKLFGLTAKRESRLAPKSAFAHNFFGFDMGFQLYPSTISDAKAPTIAARQFLQSKSKYFSAVSTPDRGAFEVNKEVGGLYWYLYRKARSNELYNTNAKVKLGTFVCPWFWFTMLAWAMFLFVSPLALLGAIAYFLLEPTSPVVLAVLSSVGAFTPLFFALRWAKMNTHHNAYKGEYWKEVGEMVIMLGLALFFAMALWKLKNYPTFWVAVFTAIFVVPHVLSDRVHSWSDIPAFSRVLIVAVFASLCNDLYSYTQFWEFVYNIFMWVVIFAWDYLAVIAAILGIAIAYLLALAVPSAYRERMIKKVDVAISGQINGVDLDRADRLITLGLFGIAGIYAVMACYALYTISGLWHMGWIFAMAFACIPLLIIPVTMSRHGAWERIVSRKSLMGYGANNRKGIREAIISNKFWQDPSSSTYIKKELDILLSYFPSYLNNDHGGLRFVRLISSDEEFFRALEYLQNQYLTWSKLSASLSLTKMILAGNTMEEIIAESEKQTKWETSTGLYREKCNKVKAEIADGANALWSRLKFTLSRLGSPIRHGYLWWKEMNEACPMSPPHERGKMQ